MAKGRMSGVSTHPMTNIRERYDKVLAQPKSATGLMPEGQYTSDNTCWYHYFKGQRVALVRTAIV